MNNSVKHPIISVIMPVYNAEAFVGEAIQSILDQSYDNFELLVFNDASTDKSLDIIQSFTDPRIKLFNSSENKGYLVHLNEGIKLGKGKYIARMDADDISLPNRFQKQFEFLEAHPEIGVCGTAAKIFGDKEKKIVPIQFHNQIIFELLTRSPIIHPSVFIRKEILYEFNIEYSQEFYTAEDYHLWVELSTLTKLHNLPDVLLKYRWHENNISKTKEKKQNSKKKLIQKKALQQLFIEEKISDKELALHSFLMYPFNQEHINWKIVYDWIIRLGQMNKNYSDYVLDIYSKNIFHLATLNRNNFKNFFPYGFNILKNNKYISRIELLKISLSSFFKIKHVDNVKENT